MTLPLKQVLLLAAYLAYKGDWVSRDELVYLFWPDEDERTARHNLSQLLYHGRKQRWFSGLEAERSRVRWLVPTDVQLFREALGAGAWQEAVRHYQGSLLDGVPLEATPTFEEWLQGEREALQGAWREAVLSYCRTLEAAGEYGEASGLLREVLRQDRLSEEILQAFMRCAGANGQREEALTTFEAFKEQLQQELDLEPLEATAQLAQAIRTKQTSAAGASAPTEFQVAHPEPQPRNLPRQLTSFIGREPELARLSSLLQDDEARLITLVGPGGIGKTRLAIQLASDQARRFHDGATFVSLAATKELGLLTSAILQALALQVPAEQDPQVYLQSALADKAMLLVLDNLEHLLAGSSLISDLLRAAPNLRVLATSREALNIHGEVLCDLKGMPYPEDAAQEPSDAYDAVALFVRSARRAQPTFSMTRRNAAAIGRICRLLDGLPLGLELAAVWVRLLSLDEISEEIASNLAVLSASLEGLPARHQSLHAVFEHSWNLLLDTEKDALKKLAVFRGGFTKDAAQAVTEASLPTLLSLVNKSLLRRTQEGRFERHVLVYQFTEEKLAQDAEEQRETQQRHAEFFLAFAQEAVPNLKGPDQVMWLKRLADEHDNLRAALAWSRQHDSGLGLTLAGRLWPFWFFRGHYQEGRGQLLAVLAAAGQTPSNDRARALQGAAVFIELAGELEASVPLYEEALATYQALGNDNGMAVVHNGLGIVARKQSDFASAKLHFEAMATIYEKIGNADGLATSLVNLSILARQDRDYDTAHHYLARALELARGIGHVRAIAISLNGMGDILWEKGRLSEAKRHYHESLKHHEQLEDPHGIALGHSKLGLVALHERDLKSAHDRIEQSLRLMRQLGDPLDICAQLHNLGTVAREERAFPESLRLHREALMGFQAAGDKSGIAQSLEGLAALAAAQGHAQRALLLEGAATALRERAGLSRSPADERQLEPYLRQARDALGHDVAQHARAEGQRLSPAEAVTVALEVTQDSSPDVLS